ncbi:hypothetical protein F5148DRAFT_534983 [Russula earlei]|uniref:Uncharacterized protein n=1 Tax=Russula earlei TaxID=71964 RepID=A0ACC0UGC7_9AGAM|nr:hypothetical protein F5148DRAFT_534983 [Russula earlei]
MSSSSTAARAEARRRAILSRGNDRLSKLTTSARGDDAAQTVHAADSPLPSSAPRRNLAKFIGDDPLPNTPASDKPPRRSPDTHTSRLETATELGNSPPEPSAWSNEQQQQFLQTLLGRPPHDPTRPLDANAPVTSSVVPDDPLLALISSFRAQAGVNQGAEGIFQSGMEAKPKRPIQKLLPILHVISVWALVAFFIVWREPEAFRARHSAVVPSGNTWSRWARLASSPAEQSAWGIEIPFFWAFISLELALHSTRIFLDFDSTQSPLLLTLILPYLPMPLSSIIMHGLNYLHILGTLVDDLAAAVVAMGLFIAASSLHEN